MPSRQQKIIKNYYEHKDTIMANRLSEIVSDLYVAKASGDKADKLWERAAAALMKTDVDPQRMKDVLKRRDLEGLAKLAGELSGAPAKPKAGATPAPQASQPSATSPAATPSTSKPTPTAPASSSPAAPISPDELKRAMGAFKKRLKLARLDAESGLSRSPLSSGQGAGIVAIQPPRQFSKAVWEELVRQGRLEHAGGGLYQMPQRKP